MGSNELESMDEVEVEQAYRSMRAAHRPAAAVSGPYGRPIHPLLVTVPIGAFVATFVFDVASVVVEGRAYGRPALWLSALGIVSGVIAGIFGLIDARRLTKGTRAHSVATTHMWMMVAVLVCFGVGFVLRRADETQFLDGTPVAALVLSGLGVVLLLGGGWLGGRLVFGFGVRVADESDQLPAHHLAASGGREPTAVGRDGSASG